MTDNRDWTVFDPKLRIDKFSNETAHIVVVTHLPTSIQASCGDYAYQSQNRDAAIARLKLMLGG